MPARWSCCSRTVIDRAVRSTWSSISRRADSSAPSTTSSRIGCRWRPAARAVASAGEAIVRGEADLAPLEELRESRPAVEHRQRPAFGAQPRAELARRLLVDDEVDAVAAEDDAVVLARA